MADNEIGRSDYTVYINGKKMETLHCLLSNFVLLSAGGELDVEVEVPFAWEAVISP